MDTKRRNSISEAGVAITGAEFSPCGVYRYALWRHWLRDAYMSGEKDQVVFIGLNPSTADATEDDPTIRRCIRFARDWGFSGMIMVNAFGFRATDPKAMMAADSPIGPVNDQVVKYWSMQAGLIVAAWGANCSTAREFMLRRIIGRTVHCLGKTKDGRPKHPLYLPKDTKPEIFWSPNAIVDKPS